MADLYKKRGENARPSGAPHLGIMSKWNWYFKRPHSGAKCGCMRPEALRAVEQQLANLYAEEVRERGRNSFLARTLEDVRDTLAAIEKGGV